MNKQLHETVSMHEISFTPSQLGKKEEKKKTLCAYQSRLKGVYLLLLKKCKTKEKKNLLDVEAEPVFLLNFLW